MSLPLRPQPGVLGSGVTAAFGFQAGTAAADIRACGEARDDVALLVSEVVATAAGVFTANRVKAAPVVLSQLHLKRGVARAVVVNSGNANACTGARGLGDALRMAQAAADAVDCAPGEVLVASTGVIGRPMPMERIEPAIARAAQALEVGGGHRAAEAIMTTDTRPKEAVASFRVAGVTHTVGGTAKGAGMIHPDMATLLAFVTSDARLPQPLLARLLAERVRTTFNTISVDGDTSTNDSCLLLANGAAGGPELAPDSRGAGDFAEALGQVLADLAEQVVADGEGATRTFSVHITGALDEEQARWAARVVSSSPLVKTAVHGGDPNWGRILAAVGRSGAELALDRCRLSIAGEELFARGQAAPGRLEQLARALRQPRVAIEMDLGMGDAQATALGCDLSPDYVRINADYTT
ncbi:MAG: bifunctional glutamate N-acetyltransferase/amino-acid acetyltransferase ArgJ [Candidatus Dormibacteria bacterium]